MKREHDQIIRLSKKAYQELELELHPLNRISKFITIDEIPALVFYTIEGNEILITYKG